ncbi:MAG: alpha/beta hydrolase fold domain-containing protein [Candidatus Hydrogenedentales bacterium]
MSVTLTTLLLATTVVVCVLSGATGQTLFIDQSFTAHVTDGIVYAQGAVQSPSVGDKDLLLDLYEPTGTNVPALKPGFILIHGGGFTSGTRKNAAMVALANAYAQRGYVTVSISYRLTGDDPPTPGATPVQRATFAAVEDAANAVGWMRDNAASLGIDTSRIAIGGASAGAITALFVGYSELGADASVDAVVSLMGGLYGSESLIDANDPALISIHGEDDGVVPFSLAQDVATAAVAAGIPFEFYPLTGVGHTVPAVLDTWMEDGVTLNVKIRDFLYTHLSLASIGDAPPNIITSNVPPGFVEEGRMVVLSAPLSPILSYQWRKNGAPLSGETAQSLSFPSITIGDSGVYSVTWDDGSKVLTTTPPFVLTVVGAGALPLLGWPGLACVAAMLIGGAALFLRRA